MKQSQAMDNAAAVYVCLFLILTALGNAWAMMVFGAAGLVAGWFFLPAEKRTAAVWVALSAAVVGAVTAVAMVWLTR